MVYDIQPPLISIPLHSHWFHLLAHGLVGVCHQWIHLLGSNALWGTFLISATGQQNSSIVHEPNNAESTAISSGQLFTAIAKEDHLIRG